VVRPAAFPNVGSKWRDNSRRDDPLVAPLSETFVKLRVGF